MLAVLLNIISGVTTLIVVLLISYEFINICVCKIHIANTIVFTIKNIEVQTKDIIWVITTLTFFIGYCELYFPW